MSNQSTGSSPVSPVQAATQAPAPSIDLQKNLGVVVPINSPVRPPVAGDDARYRPPVSLEGLIDAAKQEFGDALLASRVYRGEVTLTVRSQEFHLAAKWLRDDPRWSFDFLSDVTAIDWLLRGEGPRFENVIHLYSIAKHHRVRLTTPIESDPPEVASVSNLWPTANFHERETFDLYGIVYIGHPNLTRILMPDDWVGHPLRKDFPLGGTRSFYFKQDTEPYVGETPTMIPRIRKTVSDI